MNYDFLCRQGFGSSRNVGNGLWRTGLSLFIDHLSLSLFLSLGTRNRLPSRSPPPPPAAYVVTMVIAGYR